MVQDNKSNNMKTGNKFLMKSIFSTLKKCCVVLSLLLVDLNLNAKSNEEMNGIHFKEFKGFENKWKLVNVRYRKDNQELRFVYANKKAHMAMVKKNKIYPDGAIFAKVAYLAQPDPAFESSLLPSQTRRYQFMVKNSKRYKDANGWGYALFNDQGHVNPEPEKDQVMACHSCHMIVPERDYVFSTDKNLLSTTTQNNTHPFTLLFEELSFSSVPEMIKEHLPKKYTHLLKVKSSLTKNVFQGTLDEIKPSLAKLAVTKKLPVLFISDDAKRFTLIYPEDLKIECDDEGAKGLYVVSVNSLLEKRTNKVHFCQAY
jgi:Cytochrome P460